MYPLLVCTTIGFYFAVGTTFSFFGWILHEHRKTFLLKRSLGFWCRLPPCIRSYVPFSRVLCLHVIVQVLDNMSGRLLLVSLARVLSDFYFWGCTISTKIWLHVVMYDRWCHALLTIVGLHCSFTMWLFGCSSMCDHMACCSSVSIWYGGIVALPSFSLVASRASYSSTDRELHGEVPYRHCCLQHHEEWSPYNHIVSKRAIYDQKFSYDCEIVGHISCCDR